MEFIYLDYLVKCVLNSCKGEWLITTSNIPSNNTPWCLFRRSPKQNKWVLYKLEKVVLSCFEQRSSNCISGSWAPGDLSQAAAERQVKDFIVSSWIGLHKSTDQKIMMPIVLPCLTFIWWIMIFISSQGQRVKSRDIKRKSLSQIAVLEEYLNRENAKMTHFIICLCSAVRSYIIQQREPDEGMEKEESR